MSVIQTASDPSSTSSTILLGFTTSNNDSSSSVRKMQQEHAAAKFCSDRLGASSVLCCVLDQSTQVAADDMCAIPPACCSSSSSITTNSAFVIDVVRPRSILHSRSASEASLSRNSTTSLLSSSPRRKRVTWRDGQLEAESAGQDLVSIHLIYDTPEIRRLRRESWKPRPWSRHCHSEDQLPAAAAAATTAAVAAGILAIQATADSISAREDIAAPGQAAACLQLQEQQQAQQCQQQQLTLQRQHCKQQAPSVLAADCEQPLQPTKASTWRQKLPAVQEEQRQQRAQQAQRAWQQQQRALISSRKAREYREWLQWQQRQQNQHQQHDGAEATDVGHEPSAARQGQSQQDGNKAAAAVTGLIDRLCKPAAASSSVITITAVAISSVQPMTCP